MRRGALIPRRADPEPRDEPWTTARGDDVDLPLLESGLVELDWATGDARSGDGVDTAVEAKGEDSTAVPVEDGATPPEPCMPAQATGTVYWPAVAVAIVLLEQT